MRFLGWYRRYYLLVNIPILLALTDLVLARVDPVNRTHSSNLDLALARYAAAPPGGEPALLLVGNSAVRAGLDQTTIEAASMGTPHTHVYNFGLNTARIDDELGLVELLEAKRIKPRTVVLGLNLYSIANEDSDTRYPWHHRRSPYVFFHRSYLWNGVKEAVSRLLKREAKKAYSQFEEGPASEAEVQAQITKFVSEFRNRTADDFAQLDAIPTLVQRLESAGIHVYVVLFPLNPRATHFAAYPELLAALRKRCPATTLDMSGAYPPSLFRDVGHLNAEGRKQMTSALVAFLTARQEL